MCKQNLKTLAQTGAEKSVTEDIVREKEKWTNKGTGNQYLADSYLHSTTCHHQALYQISKSYVKTRRWTDGYENAIFARGYNIIPRTFM